MSENASTTSNRLIDEPPLLILPGLATSIGLNEAIVLQQLHFQLQNPRNGRVIDGVRYIFNTYAEWRKHFRFWSVPTIKRTFLRLEQEKLVKSLRDDKHDHNQRKFYTIDYNALKKHKPRESTFHIPKKGKSSLSARTDQIDPGSDQIDPFLYRHRSYAP
jgi:hypothetical protein